jgi:hypothetical protein
MAKSPESIESRFWRFISPEPNSGCWLWSGGLDRHGYGRFPLNRRDKIAAHRLAWCLSHGDIPSGAFVLHRCDTPACCNPEHLYLGDHAQNMRDMVKRGRCNKASGERHWTKAVPRSELFGGWRREKLTPADVTAIEASTEPTLTLVRRYGVGRRYVQRIRARHTDGRLPK